MIHTFAVEPQLVATWGRRQEFQLINDKFGLGRSRLLLELPAFTKWKRKVLEAATQLDLSQEDMKRIEELFRLFSEHRYRRVDALYDGLRPWLENAEAEHRRKPFAGILATTNPGNHTAVLIAEQLGGGNSRWDCDEGASPPRTAEGLAQALAPMLASCRQLHLVDPNFGPENPRHRRVLEALLRVVAREETPLDRICVHCAGKARLDFFEQAAAQMAPRLPRGISVEFVRWRQKTGGQRLHNRYVLTDVGGVMLGDGLDDDNGDGVGQTDDICLLRRQQYLLRWAQYVDDDGTFECQDQPATVVGRRESRRPPGPS